jgi:hypothetical protein
MASMGLAGLDGLECRLYCFAARGNRIAKTVKDQTASLLLLGLLHLIDAYSESNASETVMGTSNRIDDAA